MAANNWTQKIKSFFTGGLSAHHNLDEEFYEGLEDLLVEGDFGAKEAMQTVEALRAVCKKEKIDDTEMARNKLAEILEGELTAAVGAGRALPLHPRTIMLLLGVNGVGKTTTAAKLANFYKNQGEKVILAAADTFRAAAIDQLKIHGERLGLHVVAHKMGGDSAAVVFDALESAAAGNANMLIVDTAGRMHTKTALVEELKKIDRVIEGMQARKNVQAVIKKILVLDSTTGRNAIAQAEVFKDAVKLDGVILSKCDSTARGGAAFSLAQSLHLPILWTCNGETYNDIHQFDAKQYAREFVGL
ncbi:MAG: signal recognition particle-docking protein FtsY [Spirochaetaceae bacterium]|jgi:fused signal recognition particle receptor|nr:signal recognition particle-docking protein FtsY [Spirochaetaceae bacterium]